MGPVEFSFAQKLPRGLFAMLESKMFYGKLI